MRRAISHEPPLSELLRGTSALFVPVQFGDKSLAPYRECSADRVWPCRRASERAVWIGRFVLNLMEFWQDNCFMRIQFIAAILC